MEDIEEKKKKISALKAEKDQLYKALDGLPEAWADQLQPHVEEWIDKTVKDQVQLNPDVVKELGTEKIKSLKQKIQEIKDGHRKSIRLNAKMPHHKAMPQRKPSHIDPERYKLKTTYFKNTFSRSLSPFGELMNEYGLLKKRGHYFSYQSNSPTEFNDHQIHVYGLALSEYYETYEKYFELVDDLNDAVKELDHLEANALWDES